MNIKRLTIAALKRPTIVVASGKLYQIPRFLSDRERAECLHASEQTMQLLGYRMPEFIERSALVVADYWRAYIPQLHDYEYQGKDAASPAQTEKGKLARTGVGACLGAGLRL